MRKTVRNEVHVVAFTGLGRLNSEIVRIEPLRDQSVCNEAES